MKASSNLLSPKSIELVSRINLEGQKFLITGASGWLGRTLVALLKNSGSEVFLIGSSTREIIIDNQHFTVNKFDLERVKKFAPTVLVDFAFLTSEHLVSLSKESYRKENEALINQALQVFLLPSVRYGLFTSSGAAVYPQDALIGSYQNNPYGYLKRRTEELATEASVSRSKRCLIIRPWSLSGNLVSKDYEFAFSSFIKQSLGREILVKAKSPVYRRYCSAEDFLAMSLIKLHSKNHGTEIFDSGGELTSLLNLAEQIALSQTHDVTVVSNVTETELGDSYYSDNIQWIEACKAFEFIPESLSEQILRNLSFAKDLQQRPDHH